MGKSIAKGKEIKCGEYLISIESELVEKDGGDIIHYKITIKNNAFKDVVIDLKDKEKLCIHEVNQVMREKFKGIKKIDIDCIESICNNFL